MIQSQGLRGKESTLVSVLNNGRKVLADPSRIRGTSFFEILYNGRKMFAVVANLSKKPNNHVPRHLHRHY